MLTLSNQAIVRDTRQNMAASAAPYEVAKVINDTRGVIDLSAANGAEVDYTTLPQSTTFTATSAAGSGAENKTMYIFNDGIYNTSPTTNGSAANSITKTYDDGFSGGLINQLLRSANMGRGILCYGFNVQFTVAASGAQDQGALSTAAFTMNYFTGRNSSANPFNVDLNEAVRNTQYVSGLLTIKTKFWVNSVSQISFLLPLADKVVYTFFWKPF